MIRNAIRLGKLYGIEIGLDYSWFIVFVLVTLSLAVGVFPATHPGWSEGQYWAIGILTSLLFFGSILAHELGHSIVAINMGTPVKSITLFIFGGVAGMAREPDRPLHEFWIAIAGPAVSVALGALFWGVLMLIPDPRVPLAALAQWLSVINFAVALFNLLPGFPMDGGRVLRAILWGTLGSLLRATRIASWVGRGIAYLIILFGVIRALLWQEWLGGLWLIFIGWFLENAASMGYRQLALREVLGDHRVRELLQADAVYVGRDLELDRLINEYVLKTGRRCFPVVEDGSLLGIVTVHHIKEVPHEARATTTVGHVMTPVDETVKVHPEEPLTTVLEHMSSGGVNQVLVVEDGRYVGLVSREQLVDFIQMRTELEAVGV